MNWEEIDGKLVRNLKCQDFEEAVALFNEIAVIAESMNHHPDLRIYSYKFLSIEIYTHDKTPLRRKIMNWQKKLTLF